MWMRKDALDKFTQRLEEGDKALTGAVARDPIMRGQTSLLAQLSLGKDMALVKRGFALYNQTMGAFRADMVQLISRFQSGALDVAGAQAEWKALTATHYKSLFRAGAMASGNPYYDEIGITKHDAAFIARARRQEKGFFDGFLNDIKNPAHSPVAHPYLQRATYYSDTGKSQFFNGMLNGYGDDVEIHWVLGQPREAHCDVCPIYASRVWTWQDLPTTPRAGDTPCLFNCLCTLEFVPRVVRPGFNVSIPGAVSDLALGAPQRWASLFDLQGKEVFGQALTDVEGLYQQMYKARQEVHLFTDPEMRKTAIQVRKALNRRLIDYVEGRSMRAVPGVSVSELLTYADQAQALGGTLFTEYFTALKPGAEATLLRGNFFTKGIIKRTAEGLFLDNGKTAYRLNEGTDILFILREPIQTEGTYAKTLKMLDDTGKDTLSGMSLDTRRELLGGRGEERVVHMLLEHWQGGYNSSRFVLKSLLKEMTGIAPYVPEGSTSYGSRDIMLKIDDALLGAGFNPVSMAAEEKLSIARRAVENLYQMSQAALRKRYPSGTVKLFRGLSEKEGEKLLRLKSLEYDAATGATTNLSTAKDFAIGYGGSFVEMEVPIECVVTDDWGWSRYYHEQEWIVLGKHFRGHKAKIIAIQKYDKATRTWLRTVVEGFIYGDGERIIAEEHQHDRKACCSGH